MREKQSQRERERERERERGRERGREGEREEGGRGEKERHYLVTRAGGQEGPAVSFARTCRRLLEFVEECTAV